MKRYIVVDDPRRWHLGGYSAEVISVADYLSPAGTKKPRGARVFNLSKSYRYQSRGYYVSLLAEARGHKVIPSVKTIQELNATGLVRFLPGEIDELVQKSLKSLRSDEFTLSVYFGENVAARYRALAFALYQMFQAPFLKFRFRRGKDSWIVRGVRAIAVEDIPPQHLDFVREAARRYFNRKRFASESRGHVGYDLAILVNPEEKSPPSDKEALKNFVKAARKERFNVEFIGRDDYNRLAEFDALFIRETTSVNHHTWRFSRRAEAEGVAVIDDPESIMRCANKVFLAEALRHAGVPTPKTLVVHKENRDTVIDELGLPCVLKLPDSSFSMGVKKVETAEAFDREIAAMLAESDLVIAQEYIPTTFDWRIGILEGRAIYACKYFMARGHWQIYNWQSEQARDTTGDWETLAIDDAPQAVVKTALDAARQIGSGLYGVDLKEVDGKPVVIEINDNPSIDSDVEDRVLGAELYGLIMRALRRRVEHRADPDTDARR